MNPQVIESKVTAQFRIACDLIGFEMANDLFDGLGLNDDDTWEGKDDEAEAIVEALLYAMPEVAS
jgi:hypothetical protein